MVVFLDTLKGVIVFLMILNFAKSNLIIILSYVVNISNNYISFFRFREGQGVASTIGFFLSNFTEYILISISISIFIFLFMISLKLIDILNL